MGYEQYIRLDYNTDDLRTFKDVSEGEYDAETLAPAVNAATVCGGLQEALHQALTEIYSTEEGRELIEAAAAKMPGGQILFIDDPTISGSAFPELGIVNLGVLSTRDSTYVSIEDGELKDFSLQRVLVHELVHLTQDTSNAPQQKYEEQTDEERLSDLAPVETEEYREYKLAHEREAIEFTNSFMRKHYGEAYRNPNYTGTHKGGTPAYDIAEFGAEPSPEFLSNAEKYRNDPDYRMAVDGFTQATIDAIPIRPMMETVIETNARLSGEQCAASLQ